MADVPDPVFGGEVLGKGCAVWPEDDLVYAPCDGKVTVTMGHAVGLQSDSGIEVLVHVGVDTVNMNGDGFEGFVKATTLLKLVSPYARSTAPRSLPPVTRTASSWPCPTPPSSLTSSSPSRPSLPSPPVTPSLRSSASNLRHPKDAQGWSRYPAALFYYNGGTFYCAGLTGNRSYVKLSRLRFCVAGGSAGPLIWTYCYDVHCAGNAAPLVWRNVMKKKLLLAPLMAALVACVVLLSGCGGPSVEELITDDLTSQFDEVKNGGDDFLAGLEEASGDEFEQLGIDPKEYAKSYLEGFDYKIGDVTVDEDKGTATAEVTITCKSMNQIVEDFATQYQEKVAALDSMPSDDELYKMAGQVMVDVTKAAKTKDTTVTFKYTANDDGEWSADDSATNEMMNAMMN